MEELKQFVLSNMPERYRKLKIYKIPIMVEGRLLWFKYNNGKVDISERVMEDLEPLVVYSRQGVQTHTVQPEIQQIQQSQQNELTQQLEEIEETRPETPKERRAREKAEKKAKQEAQREERRIKMQEAREARKKK